jgi:hypothetical protein
MRFIVLSLLSMLCLTTPASAELQPAKVREVQQMLNDLGFNSGAVDGIWGPRSIAAIEQYYDGDGFDGDISSNEYDDLYQDIYLSSGGIVPSMKTHEAIEKALVSSKEYCESLNTQYSRDMELEDRVESYDYDGRIGGIEIERTVTKIDLGPRIADQVTLFLRCVNDGGILHGNTGMGFYIIVDDQVFRHDSSTIAHSISTPFRTQLIFAIGGGSCDDSDGNYGHGYQSCIAISTWDEEFQTFRGMGALILRMNFVTELQK